MSQKFGKNNNKVYKLVLTGGPCGGKTTGQARLCSFFENIGWKVYRVPETANVLIGGGVRFTELSPQEVFDFQENLLKTMMQIENTYFDLAASCDSNCLVICDRGTMDASAYLGADQWEKMRAKNKWNNVELRDNRYNQVIHMVSAANGAELFYCTDTHTTRYEGLEHARHLDHSTAQAWVGHPYFDVIDNSSDFERKVMRMTAAVCNRLDIDAGDRLALDSHKRKFLVPSLPSDSVFPQFQDFIVVHDYLVTPDRQMQARIRRRGQNVRWDQANCCWDMETGNWTYTHTIRRPEINNERPELKMQISAREYKLLLAQRDKAHYSVYKKRRCFLWNNQYFQLDMYEKPFVPRCEGLILLETYTTHLKGSELQLPSLLEIDREVTHDPLYSMHNLTKVSAEEASSLPVSDGSLERNEKIVAMLQLNETPLTNGAC